MIFTYLQSILCILFTLIMQTQSQQNYEDAKNSSIVKLKNQNAEVTILTNAGGRVVEYKRCGSQNVLKSDSSLWNLKLTKPLDELLDNNIIPFNGHIAWVGPQSDWWTQQNKNKKKRNDKSIWPPDPYLIYADCKIIKQTDSSVVLGNPASPFTRIKLTKSFVLKKNGNVILETVIKNISNSLVSWDIWLNTRVDGFNKCYVPIDNVDDIRLSKKNNYSDFMNHKIEKGYFTFEPSYPKNNAKRVAKAFIKPSSNKMFYFSNRDLFIIEYDLYNPKETHPEQGMVELYNEVDSDGEALLELEYHSPYKKLEPGQTLTTKVWWSLTKYDGNSERETQIDFINKNYFHKKNNNKKGVTND